MYDVYDIVCFFSNRDGGTIILGVKDNGAILGVEADAVDRIEKDFVTSTNNGQEINPPFLLATRILHNGWPQPRIQYRHY